MIVGLSVFLLAFPAVSIASVYEESLDDMLTQCKLQLDVQQHRVLDRNQTRHLCEKPDLDDDYRYYITSLETRFSGQKFWCFLFLKDENYKLKFKFWFSHSNYKVNAVSKDFTQCVTNLNKHYFQFGVKYNKAIGDRWESSIKFSFSSIVVVASSKQSDSEVPQIFGFDLNGIDKCPFCGHRLQSQSVGLIGKGNVTKSAKWPWHAALYYQEGFNLAYKCGGSIIRDNMVLSAAHCVTKREQVISERILKVRIETADELLSSSSLQFNVFKSNVHESYNYETFENDIALLMLESKITFTTKVQAICLPASRIENKGTGIVVGFGSTDERSDHSDVLREAEIPIVSQEVCLDSDPDFFNDHLFPGNFCAGSVGVQVGVCSGDSGGGLYMERDSLWFLKGITSNTKQDTTALNPTCNQASYALFTDIYQYSDWIETRIRLIR